MVKKHLEAILQRLEPPCLEQARDDALAHYPEEACGLFFENLQTKKIDFFQPCANLQNRLHALDPTRYPRNARRAYSMDDHEIRGYEKQQGKLRRLCGVFHSHNDVGVYFSDEDLEMACPWGEPLFPERFYMILGVEKKKFTGGSLFLWDPALKKFAEIAITL